MKFAFACGPTSSGFLFRTVRAASHFDELIVVVVSFVELSDLLAAHAAEVSEKRITNTAAVSVFRFIFTLYAPAKVRQGNYLSAPFIWDDMSRVDVDFRRASSALTEA